MKPVTSRPANSERYISCKGFKSESGSIIADYLTHVNLTFDEVHFGAATRHKKCIQHIMNIDTLKGKACEIFGVRSTSVPCFCPHRFCCKLLSLYAQIFSVETYPLSGVLVLAPIVLEPHPTLMHIIICYSHTRNKEF